MRRAIPIAWLLLCLLVVPAAAQEEVPTLAVRLRRDFGYGSGMQMQGRFSYRVDAPEDVERVEFLLDDEVIGEDTEPPFALAFNTGGFDNGWHTLSARGYTAGGEQLISNTLQRQFVPARQSYLFAGAILLLVLAFVVARYLITRPRGTDASGNKRRTYGLLGGAICPACGRPFSLPIWSINLMAGRVARCPHCGKWNFVQRASSEALVAAEALEAELEEDSEVVVTSAGEKERLRRQLDDSRYEDR